MPLIIWRGTCDSMRAHPAGPRHGEVVHDARARLPHPRTSTSSTRSCGPTAWRATPRPVRSPSAASTSAISWRPTAPRPSCSTRTTSARRMREWRTAFGDDADVYYAAKAFLCTELARWADAEGLGLDVCTGGELGRRPSSRLPGRQDRVARQQQVQRRDHPRAGGRGRPDRRRLLRGAGPGRLPRRRARAAPRGAAPRHRRRRGAHPRVHRHRPRGPEVRVLARERRRGRGRPSRLEARLRRARRAAQPHRLADLRHLRLRGQRSPGRRAGGSRTRRARGRAGRAGPRRWSRDRLRLGRRPAAARGDGRTAARDRRARVRGGRPDGAAAGRGAGSRHRRAQHA